MSPDRRRHRGAHPEDERLFAAAWAPALRAAVAELSWLLGKQYTPNASVKLVGDHHGLTERQRRAITRAACSDQQQQRRAATQLPLKDAHGQHLVVDGFNLIITIEAALSGGVLFICRDSCLRDLASVHGSYRSVEETDEAIELIGAMLAQLSPAHVRWLLDSPIANSGRLASRLRSRAATDGWPWQVETVASPDAEIIAADAIAVSADSNILDATRRWINLGRRVVEQRLPDAWIIDLAGDDDTMQGTPSS